MRSRPDNPNGTVPTGETAEVSRSQRRRQALDVLRLAQTLSAMSDAQLRDVPLGDGLLEEVRRARNVRQQIARKRQDQFLAKQMRNLDDAELDAIRAALEHDRGRARRETAQLHQIESWRERLIDGGDEALAGLLAAHPGADRQQLRQLARQARLERERAKPLHAYHELFRILREFLPHGSGEA